MKQTNKEKKHSYYFRYKDVDVELLIFGVITLLTGIVLNNNFIMAVGIVELFAYFRKLKKEGNIIYIKKELEEEQKISKAEYDKHLKKGEK